MVVLGYENLFSRNETNCRILVPGLECIMQTYLKGLCRLGHDDSVFHKSSTGLQAPQ